MKYQNANTLREMRTMLTQLPEYENAKTKFQQHILEIKTQLKTTFDKFETFVTMETNFVKLLSMDIKQNYVPWTHLIIRLMSTIGGIVIVVNSFLTFIN